MRHSKACLLKLLLLFQARRMKKMTLMMRRWAFTCLEDHPHGNGCQELTNLMTQGNLSTILTLASSANFVLSHFIKVLNSVPPWYSITRLLSSSFIHTASPSYFLKCFEEKWQNNLIPGEKITDESDTRRKSQMNMIQKENHR